ncbi:MAG: polymer-forming cytoskeletal protein [Phaeodactylibacter sp.]|nr:polymer-forming cytoskeletal protein [Phaeodactylibacter sp.]MCB9273817.1 polymer-forming cytoskeletal protein [Lewinellaceae bacterium]
MFGGNNKKETSKGKNGGVIASSTHSLNSLVQGTTIEGTVKSESDIRIDGAIKGKLFCDAKVIIGPTGFVEGHIRCQNAVIEGKFEGTLEVSELLNIRETAKISGEVTTDKLIVQSGATFNVTCSMGSAQQRKPAGANVSGSMNTVKKEEKEGQNIATAEKSAGA